MSSSRSSQESPTTPPHSDDNVGTSKLGPHLDDPSYDLWSHYHRKLPALVIQGSPEPISLGRGGKATVRVGKRDRQVSRVHARIDFKAEINEYELEVVGLNGLVVDQVPFRQHERTTLKNNATINILGTYITFTHPTPQSFLSSPILPPPLSPSSPPPQPPPQQQQQQQPVKEKENMDHVELVIRAFVYSRKSSMLASDICTHIMKQQQNNELQGVWLSRVESILENEPFFGEIVRKGKVADGSTKKNLYYYNSEADPVDWRRAKYTQVGRSARKCTLQDKQYFWKVPPKPNSGGSGSSSSHRHSLHQTKSHLGTKRPVPKEP